MRYPGCLPLLLVAVILAGCKPEPVIAPPSASPTPVPSPEVSAVPTVGLPRVTPTPTPGSEAEKPAIVLPPPPPLTDTGKTFLLSTGGHALVLEFETGGRAGYDPHPEWPGGASGVTIGIGYDCGYYSPKVIRSDWAALKALERDRLAATSGITGLRASEKRKTVKDIFVAWAVATDVFDRVDVAREFANAKRAMPGVEDLRPNAQAAIISLGFNRGWSLIGSNRLEMRAIRDLVPKRDYEGMAIQFRKMVRVWAGTSIESGMTRRRIAEAKLILTP